MRRKATDGLEEDISTTSGIMDANFEASLLDDNLEAQAAELGLVGNFANASYLSTSANPIKGSKPVQKKKRKRRRHGEDKGFGMDVNIYGGESSLSRAAGMADGSVNYRYGDSESEDDGGIEGFDEDASDLSDSDDAGQMRQPRDIVIPKSARPRSEDGQALSHSTVGLLDSLTAGSGIIPGQHQHQHQHHMPHLSNMHGLPPMPMTMTIPMPVSLPPMPSLSMPMHNFPGDVYVPPSAALSHMNGNPVVSFDHLPWLHLAEACEPESEKDDPLPIEQYTNRALLNGSDGYSTFGMPQSHSQSVLDPALAAEDSRLNDIRKYTGDIKVD